MSLSSAIDSSTNEVSFSKTPTATVTMDSIPGCSLNESWMPRVLVIHRLVSFGTLVALLWKWSYFHAIDIVYAHLPLSDSFFPVWLQSLVTLRAAFLLTIVCLGAGIWTSDAVLRRAVAGFAWLGCTVLVLHQGSHNDMTFATAWWVLLWTFWYVGRIHRIERWTDGLKSEQGRAAGTVLVDDAAKLSRILCSLILLGGAVGKWTAEYWSGQVFYEIYFADRDFWIFNWLRAHFDAASLREIATWYSRKAILVETLAGFGLWMLPARRAALAGILIFASIALLSNFLLFSVLMSMIGLASVGLFAPRSENESHSENESMGKDPAPQPARRANSPSMA